MDIDPNRRPEWLKDYREICFVCGATYPSPTADRCLCHECTGCGNCKRVRQHRLKIEPHGKPRRREAVLATREKVS